MAHQNDDFIIKENLLFYEGSKWMTSEQNAGNS